jgi:hypothetical protein
MVSTISVVNPNDRLQFSKFHSETPTLKGLGIIYEFLIRAPSSQVPGRSLWTLIDDRTPIFDGFHVTYAYVLDLWHKDTVAGNHYHKVKQELNSVCAGSVEYSLQDPKHPEIFESVILTAPTENDTILRKLFIRPGVAHKVRSLTDFSMFIDCATSPDSMEDRFEFALTF